VRRCRALAAAALHRRVTKTAFIVTISLRSAACRLSARTLIIYIDSANGSIIVSGTMRPALRALIVKRVASRHRDAQSDRQSSSTCLLRLNRSDGE